MHVHLQLIVPRPFLVIIYIFRNLMDHSVSDQPSFGNFPGYGMTVFIWDLESDYRWEKLTLETWHHHFIFTQRLVGLLVKAIDLSNTCCIICQWWRVQNGDGSKIGKINLRVFSPNFCMPVTLKYHFGS